MKKTLCAVMLIAGGYIAPASAVTISTTTNLGDLTGLAASVGNTFTGANTGDSFSDVYTFDLSSLSQAVGTTVTIQLSLGACPIFCVNGVSFTAEGYVPRTGW